MWCLAIRKQLLSESFSVLLGCSLLISLARKRPLLRNLLFVTAIVSWGLTSLAPSLRCMEQKENWRTYPHVITRTSNFPSSLPFSLPLRKSMFALYIVLKFLGLLSWKNREKWISHIFLRAEHMRSKFLKTSRSWSNLRIARSRSSLAIITHKFLS